jgi:hypothetical protein
LKLKDGVCERNKSNPIVVVMGRLVFVRYGEVRHGEVRLGSVRYDEVRLGEVRYGEVRLG